MQLSANFMVVTTILFTHTTFLWATCSLICFIPIVKQFLTHWSWLRFVPFIWFGDRAHGLCDRSTGELTPSQLWYIQRSVYAHSLICISYRTYEIECSSLFMSFHYWQCLNEVNISTGFSPLFSSFYLFISIFFWYFFLFFFGRGGGVVVFCASQSEIYWNIGLKIIVSGLKRQAKFRLGKCLHNL
jgi:hypothetical protein